MIVLFRLFFLLCFTLCSFSSGLAQRQMEKLTRGVIAMNTGNGTAFVSWRLLGTDPDGIAFNLYKSADSGKPVKLNDAPITGGTNFVDKSFDATLDNRYFVKSVVGRRESDTDAGYTVKANTPVKQYISIPLQTLEGNVPGDCSVAELDGDGVYEIIVKQEMRPRDSAGSGRTEETKFEAYKLDGTLMWRINLGKNIREGAHSTPFMVYDLDGDGRAELVSKTADGTVDGKGKVIGDANVSHVNPQGHILKGPEYLTVFDGLTGAAVHTIDYIPGRHPETQEPSQEQLKAIWGDGNGNRSERYLATIAYLDGKSPSVVMCRGYYTRAVLAAFNYKNGKLVPVWTFDSESSPENRIYRGQGNHNLSVGDVDGDGCDEIMYGACAIDHNGTGLYSTGLGHADAMHFTDHIPSKPGLEVFNIQERFGDAALNMRNAATGEIYWKVPPVQAATEGGDRGEGPGRGNALDIDPRYPGSECWAAGAGMSGMWNSAGEKISETNPRTCNFAVWWDGDLLRELLDRNAVYKWNWETETTETLFEAAECMSNNGTKSTPAVSVDLFGDWREEVVLRNVNNKELRIFTTVIPTEHRIYTLMHDPVYRLGIAWQNVAYNQPPHVGFYIGPGMASPPKPHIFVK
ncbi:MAG: rhamnogalacturonan lyase [Bacteroidales bacterium]